MPELKKEIANHILNNADKYRTIDYIRRSQRASTEEFCKLEQEEAHVFQEIWTLQHFGKKSQHEQEESPEDSMEEEDIADL